MFDCDLDLCRSLAVNKMTAVDFSPRKTLANDKCVNAWNWNKFLVTTVTTKDNYIPMTIKIYETCNLTRGPS